MIVKRGLRKSIVYGVGQTIDNLSGVSLSGNFGQHGEYATILTQLISCYLEQNIYESKRNIRMD